MSSLKSASNKERYWAIVPAAGAGKRMQADLPKQYLLLHGKSVIEYTIERLASHPLISEIIVLVAKGDSYWPKINLTQFAKPVNTYEGGVERCHSVLNGLLALTDKADANDWVLVHDAARPCVRLDDIDRLIEQCQDGDGGVLGSATKDTMKQVDEHNRVSQTLDRSIIWHAFTPQMFRYGPLRKALEQGMNADELVTDEAMAMERAGYHPLMVQGHADNIKITRPEDLSIAEYYLQQQSMEQSK